MAAPSSQDFMARLAAARTPVKTPGRDDLEARTPVKTPLRTPVKTPLRTDLEEAIFNELMDADHGPHWTSPAKSDEELFVEIAKENGSSVASDEEEAPPVYEAVRPPPAPPPSAARPPPSTPPHLAEALAPYAALIQGFARGRAATTASGDYDAAAAPRRGPAAADARVGSHARKVRRRDAGALSRAYAAPRLQH